MILVAGGEADPNVASLARRMAERGLSGRVLTVGAGAAPALTWDFQADALRLDGREVRPAAVFARHDVFASMADPRPEVAFRVQAWHAALHGWMLAHEEVRILNRRYAGQANKPFMLCVAKACGLAIPETRLTNELDALDALADDVERVAKPVAGGGYCQPLPELLRETPRRDGRAAAPALVQRRLVPPEVRVYGVGGRFIPFAVRSEALDYRAAADTGVEPLPLEAVDREVLFGLARLMGRLGMDYAAADLKTDPDTGALVFLEINSSPMFAAFDAVTGGAVSDAILDHLAGR